MIHNDIQNQLGLLVKTSAPPLIEIAQSPVEAPQWVPGQRLPAHVIASLPNGRFQVLVDDQVLDMNLPRNSEPGQKVELTFISATPRLTFALTPDLEHALPSGSGVSLSETAKFLGALLQRGSADNNATNSLSNSLPVLQGEPVTLQEFATRLRSAVSQSGLFYESHQAQWVSGERTLASLLKEPQAQLAPMAPGHEPSSTSSGSAALLIRQSPAPSMTGGASVDITPNAATLPSASKPETALAGTPVHPQSQSMVQQQLETLDTRQLLWQGQVWPGQQMDWEIEEDGSRSGQDEDTATQWRTRLHLDLPGLGGVTARLALDTSGVKVEFFADRDGTKVKLRSEIGSLANSMEASGLKVAGLMVRDDGGA